MTEHDTAREVAEEKQVLASLRENRRYMLAKEILLRFLDSGVTGWWSAPTPDKEAEISLCLKVDRDAGDVVSYSVNGLEVEAVKLADALLGELAK